MAEILAAHRVDICNTVLYQHVAAYLVSNEILEKEEDMEIRVMSPRERMERVVDLITYRANGLNVLIKALTESNRYSDLVAKLSRSQTSTSQRLKSLVETKLVNDVIHGCSSSTNQIGLHWRVLILDIFTTRLVSSCLKLHDVAWEGVTIVEDLVKKREPLPYLEAIYLIRPTAENIKILLQDFSDTSRPPMYRAIHIFFTQPCPDSLFNKICQDHCSQYIRTAKEINVAFVPQEDLIFSLEMPEIFKLYHENCANPMSLVGPSLAQGMEQMAEQIATLCQILGECPQVRYRADIFRNRVLADLIQAKLDDYKKLDSEMGDGLGKSQSQLLILDRGFDPVTPLLHELTFQAMTYDLLDIQGDIYTYKDKLTGIEKQFILGDDDDELWQEYRHEHIAEVAQNITKGLKEFIASKNVGEESKEGSSTGVKDLTKLIQQMPQYQNELSKYSSYLRIAEDCMHNFQTGAHKLCPLEQDLAMMVDSDGNILKDVLKSLIPILTDSTSPGITELEKIRLILLYIIYNRGNNGISEETLHKLMEHSGIEQELQPLITNIEHLGVKVFCDSSNAKLKPARRKERPAQYKISRWTPFVKDLIEDVIDDNLDSKIFPFLKNKNTSGGGLGSDLAPPRAALSARRGIENKKNVPRLIIFIVGGVTHSEMKVAYEVTKAQRNWEVIIGSTDIITPDNFLVQISTLGKNDEPDSSLNGYTNLGYNDL